MAKRRLTQQEASDLDYFTSRSEHSQGNPVQRNADRARERARMLVLRREFCRLETLRFAAFVEHMSKKQMEGNCDDD